MTSLTTSESADELNMIEHQNQQSIRLPNRVEAIQRSVTPVPKQKWRIPKPATAIIVCVSSRVLFDLTKERKIYQEQGLQAYLDYMITNEEVPLCPGPAFPFIKALNYINEELLKINPEENELFDVVLMSNHRAQAGITLINSINFHGLMVERLCLTGGNSVIGYLSAYQTNLYLSVDESSVVEALQIGIPAATMTQLNISGSENELRVAFDGDAVLFSDEAEVYAKKGGLDKFFEHEQSKADIPLQVGPIHKFAMTLGRMKKKFKAAGMVENCHIRTYLVTARSAASSGIRALKTLRSWGMDVDEALFLAGAPKGPILEKIQPHIFFDDQQRNVDSASSHGVASAHVPYGISQIIHAGGSA